MLLQFGYIGCKTKINVSFLNITRHYAKAGVRTRRKGKNVAINDTMEDQKSKIPIIKCKKKMYDFYKSNIRTKEKPTLASHGWKNKKTRDDYFFIYPYGNDEEKMNEEVDFKTFNDLGLSTSLCDNLENLGIYKPLHIQNIGIPKILQESNVLLAAETGCGKTLAYLLPLITKILIWKQNNVQRTLNTPLGLIVTPSRELTVQIALELIRISKHLDIKTKLITGGKTKKMILDPPVDHVDVLVCSFGVVSKLTTFGVYDLSLLRYVVLDEADALFHHTFQEKLQVFIKRLPIAYEYDTTTDAFPKAAQLILVSATIPSRMDIVLNGIVNRNSLEHVTTEKLHKILVPQKFIRLIPSQKPVELLKYIKPKVQNKERVIIFSNQNSTSYWLFLFLRECGIEATNLNGDMSLEVRRGKYGEFLNGKTLVLSTTNGGSRGLDTVMVNHILNYDFPLDTSSYIHRCGRTGRVGSRGDSRVTNFVCRLTEVVVVQKIEMAARKMKPIPIFNLVANEEEEEILEDNYTGQMIEDLNEVENIPY
ncbi:hypothetical protein K0M31_004863 [Melipona bicolor]|uniref:RNA helicase n=1 Tax=Melipona bicolor TaxID=60889 RepID=A0AA40FW74_9HYME|nr:hypothetical protein K0M31_004863 [Melipona bicolor]